MHNADRPTSLSLALSDMLPGLLQDKFAEHIILCCHNLQKSLSFQTSEINGSTHQLKMTYRQPM